MQVLRRVDQCWGAWTAAGEVRSVHGTATTRRAAAAEETSAKEGTRGADQERPFHVRTWEDPVGVLALQEDAMAMPQAERRLPTTLLRERVPRHCRSTRSPSPLPVRPVWQAMLDGGESTAEAKGALLLAEVCCDLKR